MPMVSQVVFTALKSVVFLGRRKYSGIFWPSAPASWGLSQLAISWQMVTMAFTYLVCALLFSQGWPGLVEGAAGESADEEVGEGVIGGVI